MGGSPRGRYAHGNRAEGVAVSSLDLELGDHVCVPFDTDEQALDASVAFAKAGLRSHRQVLVFTVSRSVEDLAEALADRVPGFATALDQGQAEVHRGDSVYGPDGHFEPSRVLDEFTAVIER